MKEKQKDHENKDFLGYKWSLAPGGRKIIDTCQAHTWALQVELMGYSALFRNMGSCDLDSDELYGIGLSLQRIGKRLEKVSDKLSAATMKEVPSDDN